MQKRRGANSQTSIRSLKRAAEAGTAHDKQAMLVGAWYVDQFGNQTREIKARD
jgi:hypothetical protein